MMRYHGVAWAWQRLRKTRRFTYALIGLGVGAAIPGWSLRPTTARLCAARPGTRRDDPVAPSFVF